MFLKFLKHQIFIYGKKFHTKYIYAYYCVEILKTLAYLKYFRKYMYTNVFD